MNKNSLELLIKAMKEQKITLAIAESITAGNAMSNLANIQGISDVLLGGVVTYKRETKEQILDVDAKLIDDFTAESQEVTNAMAKGLRSVFMPKMSVAITGAASEPSKESEYTIKVPVGTVFLSILYKDRLYEFHDKFGGNGEQVRQQAVDMMFKEISKIVNT